MLVAATDLRLDTTWIDYVLVAFYFVLVLGIGVLARRSVSSSLDFLLSGRSLPAWVTGLAFISANLGAIELIGMTANGAQYGMPTVHYYWIGAIPAMVFLGIVMMPFYYGSKARSVPEFLQKRFNHTTQRVNAVTFALSSVLIAGVNLFALGLVMEALLGWSLAVAIPVAALVVLSYTFLGGLSAAIYNEVLQFFVILALLVPLTVAGLARVGGWAGLQEKIIAAGNGAELAAWPGTPLTGIDNPFWSVVRHRVRARLRAVVRVLDHELRRGPARALGQGHVRRAPHPDHRRVPQGAHPAGHRHPRHDRRGAGARSWPRLKAGQPTDVTYNNTLSLLMNEVLPNGVLGVALAGLLAAFMAGMAANVSSLNTVFTYDIWQDWLHPGKDDHYYLQVGRAVTVIGCVLAIGTARDRGQLLEPDGLHPVAVQLLQRPAVRDLHPGPVLEADDGHRRLDGPDLRHDRGGDRRRAGPHRRDRPVLAGGQLRRRERGVRRRRDRGGHRVDGHAAEARRRAGRPHLVADVQGGPQPRTGRRGDERLVPIAGRARRRRDRC